VHLFRAGEQHWLTDAEAELAKAATERRVEVVGEVFQDAIVEWFLKRAPEKRAREDHAARGDDRGARLRAAAHHEGAGDGDRVGAAPRSDSNGASSRATAFARRPGARRRTCSRSRSAGAGYFDGCAAGASSTFVTSMRTRFDFVPFAGRVLRCDGQNFRP
jgi:hypothetical protein